MLPAIACLSLWPTQRSYRSCWSSQLFDPRNPRLGPSHDHLVSGESQELIGKLTKLWAQGVAPWPVERSQVVVAFVAIDRRNAGDKIWESETWTNWGGGAKEKTIEVFLNWYVRFGHQELTIVEWWISCWNDFQQFKTWWTTKHVVVTSISGSMLHLFRRPPKLGAQDLRFAVSVGGDG